MPCAPVSSFYALMKRFLSQFGHLSFFTSFRTLVWASVLFMPVYVSAGTFSPEEVVDRANRDRETRGLPTLRIDSSLAAAALLKATDMSEKTYFAHTAPDGTKPWTFFDRAGYRYRYAGENLAIHFSDVDSQEVAWMKSEKHRENILSTKYADIGVAVLDLTWEGKTTTVTVQLFGTRIGESAPEAIVQKGLSDETSLVSGEAIARTEPVVGGKTPAVSASTIVSLSSTPSTASSIVQFLFLGTLVGIGLLECVAIILVFRLFFRRERTLHLRIATPM